jgi:light-independent protochlorophyllide reductase subunit B
MGFEGANVLFDTLVHPLVMGLEEHLLTMFRDDFEFHDAAGPSHHGGHAPRAAGEDAGALPPMPPVPRTGGGTDGIPRDTSAISKPDAGAPAEAVVSTVGVVWLPAAENELKKIPFFVRGKARRNTEAYAAQKGVTAISVETLYEAKAHYAR